jgi:predicted aconitase
VLGARTQKYADYLDICAAITGRVPLAGPHLDSARVATVVIDAGPLLQLLGDECGDAFFPTLGYLCGLKSEASVPVIVGLEQHSPSTEELKAFSAAFGSTASVAMYHMAGVTPEAVSLEMALNGLPATKTVTLVSADHTQRGVACVTGGPVRAHCNSAVLWGHTMLDYWYVWVATIAMPLCP